MVEPLGPQMTSQYGAYALHAGQATLHTRTCTHPSAREHARARTHTDMQYLLHFHDNNDSPTRLSITLYVISLSCNKYYVCLIAIAV